MDYYKVIGVDRNATMNEIKQAYRKLAMRYHPDQTKEPSQDKAEERFKRINNAYSVLSDPRKRRQYDRWGVQGLQGSSTSGGGVVFASFNGASRRQRIEKKVGEGIRFELDQFARELDVHVRNLEKIIRLMIDKGITKGSIENMVFVPD